MREIRRSSSMRGAQRNQHEGEQRADIRKLGECVDVSDASQDTHHEARNPRADVRPAEAIVYLGKQSRQKRVARRREPDARLAYAATST
jgi:hypothetical protein